MRLYLHLPPIEVRDLPVASFECYTFLQLLHLARDLIFMLHSGSTDVGSQMHFCLLQPTSCPFQVYLSVFQCHRGNSVLGTILGLCFFISHVTSLSPETIGCLESPRPRRSHGEGYHLRCSSCHTPPPTIPWNSHPTIDRPR